MKKYKLNLYKIVLYAFLSILFVLFVNLTFGRNENSILKNIDIIITTLSVGIGLIQLFDFSRVMKIHKLFGQIFLIYIYASSISGVIFMIYYWQNDFIFKQIIYMSYNLSLLFSGLLTYIYKKLKNLDSHECFGIATNFLIIASLIHKLSSPNSTCFFLICATTT